MVVSKGCEAKAMMKQPANSHKKFSQSKQEQKQQKQVKSCVLPHCKQ